LTETDSAKVIIGLLWETYRKLPPAPPANPALAEAYRAIREALRTVDRERYAAAESERAASRRDN